MFFIYCFYNILKESAKNNYLLKIKWVNEFVQKFYKDFDKTAIYLYKSQLFFFKYFISIAEFFILFEKHWGKRNFVSNKSHLNFLE